MMHDRPQSMKDGQPPADHVKWMLAALAQAETAEQKGEVPVGAVLIAETGELLAAACNEVVGRRDPTAHAEMLAIRGAAHNILNYRLLNTTLYVTIEPCVMCMGAIVHARVARLVFGAKDPKWGAAGSLYNFALDDRLNHRLDIIGGVCEDQCRRLIQSFFRVRR